ncbi:MAG: SdpI family protein [Anaerotignum sp.]|nr:SdpI family protein [Anaerotignum sp.]MBR6542190.1 SdpI family protein [Anaerotignum sp.]
MNFWIFMLVMAELIPVTMMLFGCVFSYKPPKNINSIYGYRTKRSMKNSQTWEFAHHYCGKVWVLAGIVTSQFSLTCMQLLKTADVDTIGIWGGILVMVQCVILVLTIPITERALRKNFDEYGMKKEQ